MTGVLLSSKNVLSVLEQYKNLLVKRYGVDQAGLLKDYIKCYCSRALGLLNDEIKLLNKKKLNESSAESLAGVEKEIKALRNNAMNLMIEIKSSVQFKEHLMSIATKNDIDSDMAKLILSLNYLKGKGDLTLSSSEAPQIIDEIFSIVVDNAYHENDIHNPNQITKKLIVKHDNKLPANLFNSRKISSLNELSDELGDDFYLLTKNLEICHNQADYGVKINNHGGYINRYDDVDLDSISSLLPHVAQKSIIPILGDLIPRSSWGSSLANLLTKKSWDILRHQVFEENGHRCEICGAGGVLDCHESWEYHEPLIKNACGVQRLVKLMSLCKKCHDVHHLGLMTVQNRLESGLHHLKLINRWSEHEVQQYYDFVSARYAKRSQSNWALDLSLVDSEIPLVIKGSWELEADGFLFQDNKLGGSTTILLGASWKFPREDEVHPSRPIEDGYCE